MRPSPDEYHPAFGTYMTLAPEDDVLEALAEQSATTQRILSALDDDKSLHRYAEGKWSVREVFGHLIDSERILGYRALAIARGEQENLPAFEEEDYVRNASFDAWPVGALAESYALVRKTTILFYRNLSEEAWLRRGTANNNPITVRALAWGILGHERHHLGVLRDKYGVV
ncbi:MAG TPA: DinB family protein [Thermoanaerobaculia bacterium]